MVRLIVHEIKQELDRDMPAPLPQIVKADPQMPEGPALVGTPMFSKLHSLSVATVNLSSVHSLFLPISLSLYFVGSHFFLASQPLFPSTLYVFFLPTYAM